MKTSYKKNLWFDYEIVSSPSPLLDKITKGERRHDVRSEMSERTRNGEDLSQKIFMEKIELFGKSKQIHDRLTNISKEREKKTVVCFERAKSESLREVRRLCFCQSIGRKFCAVCRRDITKGLSEDVPGIIGDNDDKRRKHQPSLLKQLQQAGKVLNSMRNKVKGSDSQSPPVEDSPTEGTDDPCLSNTTTSIQPVPESTILSTGEVSSVVSEVIEEKGYKEDLSDTQNKEDYQKDLTIPDKTPSKDVVKKNEASAAKRSGNKFDTDLAIAGAGVPYYEYPVGPELIELKYINFDIYDAD